MPKAYEPELGQMCFGNAWNAIDLLAAFPAASEYLCALRDLTCEDFAYWDFANETFEAHDYWWGDEEAPEASRPNFRCGEVEIRWYKYPGRGTTTNSDLTSDQWRALFSKCIASVTPKEGA